MAFGKDRDDSSSEGEGMRGLEGRSGGQVSLIGAGMTITGNVTTTGTVRIEGQLDGNVQTNQGVVVGPEGVVNGDIEAQDAVIGGRVRGAVRTTGRLELHSTCDIEGEISAPRFKMDEGGRVSGNVRIGRAADSASPRPARRSEAAAGT